MDEGNIAENIYTSDAIGWTIEIPEGWEITKKSQIEEEIEVGMEAVDEVIEEGIDFSTL
ncbi:MAG: hypothetical protein IIA45_15680 [Bacteroidetes bacterium]|nr:hypothetical protein [Bacteroidota bacterium]